jgi:hypothetical protein
VKIFRSIDNIDYDRDKTETLADREDVLVGFEGQWVKLDLSDANYGPLAAQLRHLLSIGEPVKGQKKPQASRSHGRRSAEYYARLIRWTDEHKITKKDGTGRIAYAPSKPGGRNDYPDWLIRDYDHFTETGELPGYARAA